MKQIQLHRCHYITQWKNSQLLSTKFHFQMQRKNVSLIKTSQSMKEHVPSKSLLCLSQPEQRSNEIVTSVKKCLIVWEADWRAGKTAIPPGLTASWVNCRCPHNPEKRDERPKRLTGDTLYICFDRWFSHFTRLTKDHFHSGSYKAKPLLNEMIKNNWGLKHQSLRSQKASLKH